MSLIKIRVEKVMPNAKNPNVFGIAYNNEWYSIYAKGGKCPLVEGQEYEVELTEKQVGDKVFKNIHLSKGVDATETDKKYNVVEPGHTVMTKDELEEKVGPMPENRIEKMALLKAACFYSNNSEECIANAQKLLRSLDQKWLN